MSCYCGAQSLSADSNLQCKQCGNVFHPACLKSGRPSNLEGDVLFEFVCIDCSPTKEEKVTRMKLQWSHILILTLYNLQLQGGGKCGFYQWREQICNFIQKNWPTFFGFTKKRTFTWRGTVAGALSAGCPSIFVSGASKLKEQGWWTLRECRPPTRRELEAGASATAAERRKRGSSSGRSKIPPEAVVIDVEPPVEGNRRRPSQRNKRAKTAPAEAEIEEPSMSLSEELGLGSLEGSEIYSDMQLDEDLIDISPGSMSPLSLDPPSPTLEGILSQVCGDEAPSEDAEVAEDESNNESSSTLNETAVVDIKVKETEPVVEQFCMARISHYEERKLLQELESNPKALAACPEAKRLRRKLLLIKLKRERNLPIFNLDHFVTSRAWQAEGKTTSFEFETDHPQRSKMVREDHCILDRFQISSSKYIKTRQGLTTATFMTKLVGNEECNVVISPYTARRLKPYIWQDFKSKPLKLRLLEEIQQRAKKFNPDWTPPPPSPINYCYVQPHHIPSVNAICKEFFWPGIDLSECLQYPDFSCVVTYKKVVIGFAFMVPDVKYNEAYITFIFTHPEWRNAGIATFMLYHLIQTCMGKDVTLHVSATNPALFLYQKFGFKVEEFIVDFYDKFYPVDSKECKHAMFIRLSR